jgi:CubicO group peptidase (beta-lactamase class C family)
MNRCRLSYSLLMTATLSLLGACASQPGLSSSEIDKLAYSAMQAFSVPGAVVGVVKDGKVVHAAGYGVRELGLPGPVDRQTLFRIASMTKAMTTTALAMLVDEGKLGWDDKVVDHIPGFQMYDPWITQEFTVTDLVTHRSGLRAYVGDLMLWPRPNSFTREDIIHGLRYFKPVGNFRTQYDYDNQLYIVAGELIPAVTGDAWEDFVDQRIFARLDSGRCFAGRIPEREMQNLAVPHATVEGKLQIIDRNRISDKTSVDAATGGVRCSLDDILKWVQVQLDHGALTDGSRLFSQEQSAIMWSPKTILDVSADQQERDGTHFSAYGLGWRLADVHGFKRVSHTGSFTGFNNYMILIPELDLGVVVMLNASAGAARQAIMKGIVTPYLGVDDVDWVEYFSRQQEPAPGEEPEAKPVRIDYENGSVLAPLSVYTGTYTDPWFGDVFILMVEDELWFASAKSPRITGRLWPQTEHTFIARWSDRTVNADAWVMFEIDESGSSNGIKMLKLSKDSEIDFMDLDFSRIEEE